MRDTTRYERAVWHNFTTGYYTATYAWGISSICDIIWQKAMWRLFSTGYYTAWGGQCDIVSLYGILHGMKGSMWHICTIRFITLHKGVNMAYIHNTDYYTRHEGVAFMTGVITNKCAYHIFKIHIINNYNKYTEWSRKRLARNFSLKS